MRRTATLTALLLGAALLAPTGAATAAGETCRGESATIVGTEPTLDGTEGRDVIVTGTAVRVHAHGGEDLVCVQGDGRQPSFVTIEGGSGNDTIQNTIQTGIVDVDAAGRASLNGIPWLQWSGFEDLELSVVGNAALTVTGTEADDAIMVSTGFVTSTISAALGAGDDHFTVWAYDSPGLADIDAGSGRDTVAVVGITSVKADLRQQTLRWGAVTHALTGVENVSAHGTTVRLVGDDQRNLLQAGGCTVRAKGGDGPDRVEWRTGEPEGPNLPFCPRDVRLDGGNGRDRIEGSRAHDLLRGGTDDDLLIGRQGRDTILGGTGRDRAQGGTQRDICRAEVRKSCER